jgi:hypothetical protein
VLALLAEVIRARQATTAMEVAHATAVLAVETSVQEAAITRDSAALHVKDVADRATLAEREELERVSRVEVENTSVLASAREDDKGFVWKIALLEGELTTGRRA